MKKLLFIALLVASPIVIVGQDQKPADPAAAGAVPLNAAETKFKELLANSTLAGRWASVKDGELGEEKQDQYNIVSASKVKDDSWVILAKMKYRDREMEIPFPVKVQFAGDTPVIVVDQLAVPGGGTYSARVLFFEKTYAGSWTGADGRGGLISGVIKKRAD
jgi:hypothetical protein